MFILSSDNLMSELEQSSFNDLIDSAIAAKLSSFLLAATSIMKNTFSVLLLCSSSASLRYFVDVIILCLANDSPR